MMSDREKSIASDESLCNQQQQQHQQHYEDYDSVDTFADNEPSAPVRDNNHTNSKSTSVGSVRPVSVSVLEEMKEGLALSMLAFLAADLRLMSATGRIATKYETVAVESDFVIRNNRESCAVLMNNNQEESSRQQQEAAAAAAARIPEHVRQGLSPAQLMAVVLIEMKKTFEQQQRQDVIIKNLKRQSGNRQPEAATAFTAFLMDHKKDKNNWEDDLNTLMKAYAQMIGADLDEKVPHIDARRSMLNLMNFATLDQQNAPGSNNTTLTDTNNNNNGESSTSSRRVVTLPSRQAIMANMDYHRKELFDSRNTKEFRQMEAVTDALFNMAAGATDGREHNRRLRQSIQHMQLSTGSSIQSTITSDGQPEQRHATTNNHHNHNPSLSSDDLLAFMEKAVESRKDANLEFMSNFFRAGTVSQVMITSNVRVVWINDWFSQLDLIYAIAVDADQRRVLVIFRGAITRHDWAKAFEYTPARVENPVRDEYEGRTDHIGIHKGFYQYLFRVRKDTGTTKYEEIVNVAHRYGMERIGEGYTLAVTGHSLGAALSTVFAFQASTDERFTRNGPIKIMTFGCPYIGDHYFADAFRHQEETGRVMAIRCYNHNDFVSYAPWNFTVTKRGSRYRHVGIGVRIPPVRWLRSWSPKVSYVPREGCLKAYARGIHDNFLLNSAAVWNIKKMHTLGELQRRMAEGALRRRNNGGYDLLEKPIEELYKELVGVNLDIILEQRQNLQTEKK